MPYYRVTVTDIYGRVYEGVKYDHLDNIDLYYAKANRAAALSLRRALKTVDVVMLREESREVQLYLQKRRNGGELLAPNQPANGNNG